MVKTAISSAMGVGKSRKASELRRTLLGGAVGLLVDPLGFDAGDSNLYRYVNNEPTTNSDPKGLETPNWGRARPRSLRGPLPAPYAIGGPYKARLDFTWTPEWQKPIIQKSFHDAGLLVDKMVKVLSDDALFKKYVAESGKGNVVSDFLQTGDHRKVYRELAENVSKKLRDPDNIIWVWSTSGDDRPLPPM